MGICGSCDKDDAKKECKDNSQRRPPLLSSTGPQKYDCYGTIGTDGFSIANHKTFDEIFAEGAAKAIDLTESSESGEDCDNNNIFSKSKRTKKKTKRNVGPRSGTRVKMKHGVFTGVSGTFIRNEWKNMCVVRMDGGRGVRKVAKDDIILL